MELSETFEGKHEDKTVWILKCQPSKIIMFFLIMDNSIVGLQRRLAQIPDGRVDSGALQERLPIVLVGHNPDKMQRDKKFTSVIP